MDNKCACAEAIGKHSFSSVEDSVVMVEKDLVLANVELLARSDEKWMSIYRCRVCSILWAEACWSSGHMDVYYLYPAPPTDDPVRWLNEKA